MNKMSGVRGIAICMLAVLVIVNFASAGTTAGGGGGGGVTSAEDPAYIARCMKIRLVLAVK